MFIRDYVKSNRLLSVNDTSYVTPSTRVMTTRKSSMNSNCQNFALNMNVMQPHSTSLNKAQTTAGVKFSMDLNNIKQDSLKFAGDNCINQSLTPQFSNINVQPFQPTLAMPNATTDASTITKNVINSKISFTDFSLKRNQSLQSSPNNYTRGSASIYRPNRPFITLEMIENEEKEPDPNTFNFEKCNMTIKQIQPDNKKIKQQVFQDAEYWVGKGYSVQKNEGIEVALDYYLHGIRANPYHYACIYNLACVFYQLHKHLNARKWFNQAIKVQPQTTDAYFGSALSSFILREYQQAYDTLKSIPSQSQSLFVKPDQIAYFRALCLKQLGDYRDAEKEYKSIEKILRINEGRQLIKYVFSLTLLPLQNDRKLIEDYLENFAELMSFKNAEAYFDRTLQNQLLVLYHSKSKTWTNTTQASKVLQTLPFLQRLDQEYLLSLIQKGHLQLTERKQNDLIFNDSSKILFIVNGRLLLRQHQKNCLEHKLIASYNQGMIIGYGEIDDHLTNDSNIWAICGSKVVQYFQIDREVFQTMWRQAQNKDTQVQLAILQQIDLVKQLFLQTQFAIAYEFGQRVRYQAGEVILCQHPRSPLNPYYDKIYDPKGYYNKMQLEIQKTFIIEDNEICNFSNICLTSVYEGYIRAVSKKSTNLDLIQAMVDNQEYNQTVKKKILNNIGGKLMKSILSNRHINESLDDAAIPEKIKKVTPLSSSKSPGHTTKNLKNLKSKAFSFNNTNNTAVRESLKMINGTEDIGKEKNYDKALTMNSNGINDSFTTSFDQLGGTRDYNLSETKVPMRPIIIILEGRCKIVNQKDKYQVGIIKRGDVFGESEFLKLPGYDFFGDIIADENGVECLVIQNPDEVITLYEKGKLVKALKNKLDGQRHLLETKYHLKSMTIHKY